MNLFDLFRPKTTEKRDFSAIGTDMHSHLIPGVDDGARTMKDAIALIRGLKGLGYKKLITTPHVMADHYPNTKKELMWGLVKLRKAVNRAKIRVEVDVAAEYMLDEGFVELLDREDLLTLDGRHVLVEMGFIAAPPNLHELLFQLQTKGYTPILAHPERYSFYGGNLPAYRDLKDRGCLFQLNILSVTGYYGPAVQKTSERLLKAGMIDFLGSDLHHQYHVEQLQEALEMRPVQRMLARGGFRNETL
jgi:protein-tyrosine phosphatase